MNFQKRPQKRGRFLLGGSLTNKKEVEMQRKNCLVKISGDVLEKETFDWIAELTRSYFVVVCVGGGTQINKAFLEEGLPVGKFGPLGRETKTFRERQFARDLLEKNQQAIQDAFASRRVNVSVIIPVLDIGTVLCHVNGDQFILTAYHGFNLIYIVTTKDRVAQKSEFFVSFEKIRVIGTPLMTNQKKGPASESDIDSIFDLLAEMAKKSLTRKLTKDQIKEKLQGFLVVKEVDSQFIGCGCIQNFQQEKKGFISSFAVHPSYHGEGIGINLLVSLESKAKEEGIELFSLVDRIRNGWWRSRGFQQGKYEDLPEAIKDLYDRDKTDQSYKSFIFVKRF